MIARYVTQRSFLLKLVCRRDVLIVGSPTRGCCVAPVRLPLYWTSAPSAQWSRVRHRSTGLPHRTRALISVRSTSCMTSSSIGRRSTGHAATRRHARARSSPYYVSFFPATVVAGLRMRMFHSSRDECSLRLVRPVGPTSAFAHISTAGCRMSSFRQIHRTCLRRIKKSTTSDL